MTLSDEDVLTAIEAAIEDGDTLPTGGAPIDAITNRLPIGRSATNDRLRQLTTDGQVTIVVGLPKDGRPQPTYRPVAAED